MKLFWEQGYEGTSFDQLIRTMGISPSSFYNSFGSKEQLYKEATDAYLNMSEAWFAGRLFGTADTREAFKALLDATAVEYSRQSHPSGCMISLAGTHLPPDLNSVREMMVKHRADAEDMIAQRLRNGVKDGDLPSDTDVPALAAFYSAVTRGMAVQARDGAGPQKLKAIADVAMQAWPVQSRKARSARPRRARVI
ncbi:TetR family transcriptional regulator [Paraburkholderia phytofirmans OLGA172]|uniref:TetR family transcriptional regulator n=1 Tax=Paraburkholderia phytofirmans OLGA172 TaxID=1417228 RepID=A0A167WLJ7_9BURK|nr:TetR/AcrR family transcriptional regulator [Paraburkholderia phytofirmans]ANB77507.1 TetR family transcriptional regulator [Paraburkholderia phytofirmans OLGA172]